MWHIHPTEKWLDKVVIKMNEKQLKPEESKFMIAFFSSMDSEFVEYFQTNKSQISSFSVMNFHIFTPLIFEDKVIPDEDWRYMRSEFNSLGIPVSTEPTFVFFNLEQSRNTFVPNFFAGFECRTFDDFPRKLKNVIDKSVGTTDINALKNDLAEIFLTKNIISNNRIDDQLKKTISQKLPDSKIFISHSSIDKPFVRKLERKLSQDDSIKFWIDENEILVGDDIQNVISDGLKDSDFLFIIISENSAKSTWVNFEISQFMGFTDNKNIIPIILSKGESFSEPINNLIRRLKYLDFSDESNWEQNINELKTMLNKNKRR